MANHLESPATDDSTFVTIKLETIGDAHELRWFLALGRKSSSLHGGLAPDIHRLINDLTVYIDLHSP